VSAILAAALPYLGGACARPEEGKENETKETKETKETSTSRPYNSTG
jgi:hypothetical protein